MEEFINKLFSLETVMATGIIVIVSSALIFVLVLMQVGKLEGLKMTLKGMMPFSVLAITFGGFGYYLLKFLEVGGNENLLWVIIFGFLFLINVFLAMIPSNK